MKSIIFLSYSCLGLRCFGVPPQGPNEMFAVCIFYQLTQGVCVSVLIKDQVSQGPEYCVI